MPKLIPRFCSLCGTGTATRSIDGYRPWDQSYGLIPVCETCAQGRTLLAELLDAYVDACHQGSGNEPLSSPTWHNFLSTYEDADELIPRVRAFLRGDLSK